MINNFSFFSNVYAHPYNEFKLAFRYNFRSFCQVYDGPWMTFGDFNDITTAKETFGGNKPVVRECMILIVY